MKPRPWNDPHFESGRYEGYREGNKRGWIYGTIIGLLGGYCLGILTAATIMAFVVDSFGG